MSSYSASSFQNLCLFKYWGFVVIYNVMFYFIALLIIFIQNVPSSYGAETKIYTLSVNTKADEDDPYYCLGARTSIPGRLYFTRKSETGKWDIFWAKFDSTKRTLGKEEMVGAQIESTGDDQTPFVSPEGVFPQWILFSSSKDKPGSPKDIYVSLRDGPLVSGEERGFGPSRPINEAATSLDESHPWIHDVSTKQCFLYFNKKTEEGLRLFRCQGTKAKGSVPSFAEAKQIEEIPVGFSSPTLTPDGKVMFLQGQEKDQSHAIFVSYLQMGTWTLPKVIPGLVFENAKRGTKSPRLTRDGKTLYFSSDRPGGKGGLDIYYVSVSDLQLPK